MLVAGLDNVKGIDGAGAIMPACGPNDMSNKRYYCCQIFVCNPSLYVALMNLLLIGSYIR